MATMIPAHKCLENLVTIGDAARNSGVPYQYVYGRVQRHRQFSAIVRGTRLTCQVCTEAFYGKAGTDGSGAELLAEPIQGYRAWKLTDTGLLVSWYDSAVWPTNTECVTARCADKSHAAPHRRCRCGLYALNSMQAVLDYWNHRPGRADVYTMVFGAVDLWGRYIKAEDGWKAAKGRPTALLCVDWASADTVHRVATKYGISVAHNVRIIEETNWGSQNQLLEGGEIDGDRYGTGGGRGDAATDETASRAACRDAVRGASTKQELRYLVREGIISISNVEEVLTT